VGRDRRDGEPPTPQLQRTAVEGEGSLMGIEIAHSAP
jgi:hypothetical protein